MTIKITTFYGTTEELKMIITPTAIFRNICFDQRNGRFDSRFPIPLVILKNQFNL